MKYGNACFAYQPPGESHKEVIDRFIRLGIASEELGFDTYWTHEHHFTEHGLTGNLFVACANLLGRTKKLNVGTMGIMLATASPARQTENLLLLDQMSKGRFNFGVERGMYHKDFRVFGADIEQSRAITEDFHSMIMASTKTGILHTDSRHIECPDVNVYPEAFLDSIPTCMTAESAVTTTWLAERGLPMSLSWMITSSEKKAQMSLYNAVAAECGYNTDCIDHSMVFICAVDDDGEKAENTSREFLGNWYDSYVHASNLFIDSNQSRGYDYHKGQWRDFILQGNTNTKRRIDYSHDLNPIGTPEKCIEIIQRDIDATGITNVVCTFEANGSEERMIASMASFMSQIAPYLRDPK